MSVSQEQRKYPRLKPPQTVVAAWQSGVQRDVSYVESLGLSGLYLRTKKKVALRSLVQLLLDMPLGQVQGRAVVRWVSEQHGMGLRDRCHGAGRSRQAISSIKSARSDVVFIPVSRWVPHTP